MFFLKKKVIPLSAIAIAGLALAPTGASAFTLDAFNSFPNGQSFFQINGQANLPNSVTREASGLGTDNTFGGSRTITLSQVEENAASSAFFLGNAGAGTAELINGNIAVGVEIVYDGFANDPVTGSVDGVTDMGQNITSSGGVIQRSIALTLNALGVGSGDQNLDFNFDIRDTTGSVLTLTRTFTVADNFTTVDGPRTELFVFDGTPSDTVTMGSVDLTSVEYISFYTSSENEADDFSFSFLATSEEVPFEFSPGMGLLLGGGLFGWMKLRRKQKLTK